jgi:dienelactone hydrolase
MPARSPEEIRASIEHNRQELGTSLDRLRVEVERMTDWRSQLRRHQPQLVAAAAVTGFVLGGGVAALSALTFGRRKRRGARCRGGPAGAPATASGRRRADRAGSRGIARSALDEARHIPITRTTIATQAIAAKLSSSSMRAPFPSSRDVLPRPSVQHPAARLDA